MDDEERRAFEALRRIMRAADLYSRWLLREHHLTAPQLIILTEIARHQEVPLGVLARATHMGSPTATGVVDRLERQGLVVRTRSESDRRRVFVALTEAGRRLVEKGPPLLSRRFRSEFHQLSPDRQRQVCETLRHVADMMEDGPE